MLTSSPPKKDARPISTIGQTADNSNDLKFISELGRSLLFTVHPKKVAERVAEAIQNVVDAEVCMFVAELENIGLISCSYNAEGEITSEFLDRATFEKWLKFMPPQIAYSETAESEFLINNGGHRLEYVSPLHIHGEITGAIVVGLGAEDDLTEHKSRLIDAATQMAAMSINLSAHYGAALNSSINEAREEHRKFTEAILDALPVSLYVVDRDYRIVTWNRHREIGVLGIPRDLAIGRDVFSVLEKYPQGRLRQEFERAFRTGNIERIEQQTAADDGSSRHWMVSKVPMKNSESARSRM